MAETRKRKADEALVKTQLDELAAELQKAQNKYDAKRQEFEALPSVKKRKQELVEAEADAIWQKLISVLEADDADENSEEIKWLSGCKQSRLAFADGPLRTEDYQPLDLGMATKTHLVIYALTDDLVTVRWDECDMPEFGSDAVPTVTAQKESLSADDVRFAKNRRNAWGRVLQRVPDAKWHLGLLVVRHWAALHDAL